MTTKTVLGPEVAEVVFNEICDQLGLDPQKFKDTEKDEATKDRLTGAISTGRLEYSEEKFKLTLISPINVGSKTITYLDICEPDGVQLRSMSEVKKNNDDVGKAMAVLGSVTGLGLPVINKLKSRDLMVAVEVIGLFL